MTCSDPGGPSQPAQPEHLPPAPARLGMVPHAAPSENSGTGSPTATDGPTPGDRPMAAPSMKSVVRTILSTDLDMPADEVIKRAKAEGLKASDQSIRWTVHNVRSALKRG